MIPEETIDYNLRKTWRKINKLYNFKNTSLIKIGVSALRNDLEIDVSTS